MEFKYLPAGIEIGAFCVSQNISKAEKFTVSSEMISFARLYAGRAQSILVSLTNSAALQEIYLKNASRKTPEDMFLERREQSPGVDMFWWNECL